MRRTSRFARTTRRDRRMLLALHEFVTGERLAPRSTRWRRVLGVWLAPG